MAEAPVTDPSDAADDADAGYGISPTLIEAVEEALDAAAEETAPSADGAPAGDAAAEAQRLVAPLHAADLADLLEHLHPDHRTQLVDLIRPRIIDDPEMLSHLDEEVRGQVLPLLAPQEIAQALAELDSDDALGLAEDLADDIREAVLEALPARERLLVEEGLTFPEYSAGRLMQREVVAVPMFWTVGKTIDWLRTVETLPDDFHIVLAVDPAYRPTGIVKLSQILRNRRSSKIRDLTDDEIRTIPAEMDQEEVAFLFRQYGLVSAPVVDPAGRLIGVITVDDVVDVIDEEAEDDLLKLGGVSADDLYRATVQTTRSRFAWLAVNLLTAIIASGVIALFEATIQQVVALAVLMPIVASMGGNAGTQSLTVAVRAIAVRELSGDNAARVLWKEVLVGSLNGLIFAAIAGPIAALWFGDVMIGLVIAVAMVVTLTCAGFSGTVIPLLLDRLKVDPAVASSVFLTTVTDVVGFFAFLGLAAWILL